MNQCLDTWPRFYHGHSPCLFFCLSELHNSTLRFFFLFLRGIVNSGKFNSSCCPGRLDPLHLIWGRIFMSFSPSSLALQWAADSSVKTRPYINWVVSKARCNEIAQACFPARVDGYVEHVRGRRQNEPTRRWRTSWPHRFAYRVRQVTSNESCVTYEVNNM